MILKSIIINGFKSFGKKVTIDVTHNVTGVVGPNGSGKSNVAEAIRFVLGEQSMKNMRSKLSSDLIFKGSNSMNALNRASVELIIDNKERRVKANVSHDLAMYLEYDEIKLARELYADGESKYKINDGVVRLKDVQELLALAGIGNSAHTLISQGEADRILLASNRERKEIMEDALGLKVYYLRIKESEKKLQKVEEHKREIEIIKKELKPELYELGRMVKIIESRKEEVNKLEKYVRYFVYREKLQIKNRRHEINNVMGESGDDRYVNVNSKDELLQKLEMLKSELVNESAYRDLKLSLQNKEKEFTTVNDEYNVLVGKKETLMQIQLEATSPLPLREGQGGGGSIATRPEETITFSKSELEHTRGNIDNKLDNAIYNAVHNNHAGVISNIGDAKHLLDNIFKKEKKIKPLESAKPDYSNQIFELEQQIETLINRRHTISAELANIKSEIDKKEQYKYNLLKQKNDIESKLREIEYASKLHAEEKLRLDEKEKYIEQSWAEAAHIIGQALILNQSQIDEADELYTISISELEKKIEKSKMRIDDGGIADAANIVRSYEEVVTRDKFLTDELTDITRTEIELRNLIVTLRATLREDFNKGVEKISFVFNNYFHEVFGGGRARLSVGVVDDEDELVIDINIPEKKVKDLHMLSGGERSLVSIALIFAMSSIAPPPFIVLDETDAALDEMNAKRYGKMLDKLAERSKLLVITHNRATMNECDVLYGVTLGADGASRILSIEFEK